MNSRRRNQQGKNELQVKEVIFPRNREEEPGTSQGFHWESGDTEDSYADPVKIGEHEVKPVKGLKLLEKKPLEDYFGGTKYRRPSKRKPKIKRTTYSLSDFDVDALENGVNDIGLAAADSDSPTEEIKEEMLKAELLRLKIFKHQKNRECNAKKTYTRQRLAEENYKAELENMAETWAEYTKRRHQLEMSGNCSHPRPPRRKTPPVRSRIGFSIISRKYWNDDKECVSIQREDKAEDVRKVSGDTLQESNYDELGEDLVKKLVFVYDENSDEPP